jgi:hypothetical protein
MTEAQINEWVAKLDKLVRNLLDEVDEIERLTQKLNVSAQSVRKIVGQRKDYAP